MDVKLLTYFSPEAVVCHLREEKNILTSGTQSSGEDMTTGGEEDW